MVCRASLLLYGAHQLVDMPGSSSAHTLSVRRIPCTPCCAAAPVPPASDERACIVASSRWAQDRASCAQSERHIGDRSVCTYRTRLGIGLREQLTLCVLRVAQVFQCLLA